MAGGQTTDTLKSLAGEAGLGASVGLSCMNIPWAEGSLSGLICHSWVAFRLHANCSEGGGRVLNCLDECQKCAPIHIHVHLQRLGDFVVWEGTAVLDF